MNRVEWTRVDSTMVTAFATDGDDLLVRFKNGSIYKYFEAAEMMPVMLKAESAGKAFIKQVREKFASQQVVRGG